MYLFRITLLNLYWKCTKKGTKYSPVTYKKWQVAHLGWIFLWFILVHWGWKLYLVHWGWWFFVYILVQSGGKFYLVHWGWIYLLLILVHWGCKLYLVHWGWWYLVYILVQSGWKLYLVHVGWIYLLFILVQNFLVFGLKIIFSALMMINFQIHLSTLELSIWSKAEP